MAGLDVDLIGETIDGRYRVEYRIGTGGMGTVWRAQHVQTLQYVAVKTLRVSEDYPEAAIQRCLKEARAAAALKSRHVVRVIDVQPDYVHRRAALPYLVMELLEGIDFESVLFQREALTLGEAAWVIQQVSRGLQMAHEQGIVHRDLKPANLFLAVDDDGAPVVKICDFGLAKVDRDGLGTSSTGASSETGSIVGTPRYMAPEQLRGLTRTTAATDQWAMGLIAYRLLSGEDYFGNAQSSVDLSLRIVHDEMQPPSETSSRVPKLFDRWFLRSCARESSARFGSAMEQARALLEAMGNPELSPLESLATPAAHGPVHHSVSGSIEATVASDALGSTMRRSRRMFVALGVSAGVSVLASVTVASRLAPIQHGKPISTIGAVPAAAPSTGSATNRSVDDQPTSRAAASPLQAPTPPSPMPRQHKASTTATVTMRKAPSPAQRSSGASTTAASLELSAGASCTRSSQCASRLCVAERCR
jgi:serine/threonine-protein kinase